MGAEEIKNAFSSYKAYPNDIRVSSEELSNKFGSDKNLISDIVNSGQFSKADLEGIKNASGGKDFVDFSVTQAASNTDAGIGSRTISENVQTEGKSADLFSSSNPTQSYDSEFQVDSGEISQNLMNDQPIFKNLENDIGQIKDQFTDQMNNIDQNINQMSAVLASNNNNVDQMKAIVNDLAGNINGLKIENQEIQNEIAEVTKQLEAATKELAELGSDVESLTAIAGVALSFAIVALAVAAYTFSKSKKEQLENSKDIDDLFDKVEELYKKHPELGEPFVKDIKEITKLDQESLIDKTKSASQKVLRKIRSNIDVTKNASKEEGESLIKSDSELRQDQSQEKNTLSKDQTSLREVIKNDVAEKRFEKRVRRCLKSL